MAIYIRKRRSLGPLSLNLSRSGVGISIGIRGLRAGITSHGRLFSSASLPGSGIYWRRYYSNHHAEEPTSFAAGFWLGVLLVPSVLVLIAAYAAR